MAATWKVSSTMGETAKGFAMAPARLTPTPCTPSRGRVPGVARTEIAEPLGLVVPTPIGAVSMVSIEPASVVISHPVGLRVCQVITNVYQARS